MKRRNFIQACALGGTAALLPFNLAAAAAPAPSSRAEETGPILKVRPDAPIIIKKVDILQGEGYTFLRATAADGRVGFAVCNPVIKTYAPILRELILPGIIGKDARDIEKLIDEVYVRASNYKRAGLIFWSCFAWVEIALLDLIGQAAGKPIGALFGPVLRTEIPVYTSSTTRDTSPQDEVAAFQQRLAERGCRAIKYKIGGRMSGNEDAAPGRTAGLIALAAKTFGPSITQYADANGSYDVAHAIAVGHLLEDHGVKWYEEPCPFEEFEQTREVAAALKKIAVVGGEQDTSPAMFRWLIENKAIKVAQPDLVYNGGFIRTLRIARLARRAGIPLTPHSPSTGIHAVNTLHYASVSPNAGDFQEYHIDAETPHPWASVTIRVKDGKAPVPQGPGKGYTIDPAYLAKAEVV